MLNKRVVLKDDWEDRLLVLILMSFFAGSIVGWLFGWYL
jgi:hypothetical protein